MTSSQIYSSPKRLNAAPPTLDEFQIPESNNIDGNEGISSDAITLEELDEGIKRLGTGTGLDGVNPNIMQIIPGRFKDCLVLLYVCMYLLSGTPDQNELLSL